VALARNGAARAAGHLVRTRRTGLDGPGRRLVRVRRAGRLDALDADPVAAVRYLEALALPGGAIRIWYEAPLADESHELRTELIA
jgi:hypothetical protein